MVRFRNKDLAIDAFVHHYQQQRPLEWSNIFAGRKDVSRPLDVEIGSGLGEFIARTALDMPDRDFVGIELEWERIKKTLRRIVRIREDRGHVLENVRILQIDASVALQRLFQPESVSKFYCLFPCPWPKKSHTKYRLFSKQFIQLLNSRLIDGGSLTMVTDYKPYFNWVQQQVPDTGFEMKVQTTAPRFNTKFERKWREQGQEIFYELILIKSKHVSVSLLEDSEVKVFFAKKFNPERFKFQDVTGQTSIVCKNFLFDEARQKGMVHLVVAETGMTQHLWVSILRTPKDDWCIAKTEGHTALPTEGVANGIHRVYEAVCRSAANADLTKEN